MDKLPEEKVAAFLNELHQSDVKKFEIVEQCRSLFFSLHPNGSERMMYGGIMFSLKHDVAGVFAYKSHVSFEFGLGHSLDDPNNLLEGNGKLRRHIKLQTIEQIKKKQLKFFIAQLT
ncbi:MAG: DUF1801 domain-containing protein [Devosiaceae bacterium]|nr:DUF1801 domain-containing protein [Devosiaceae bacterium]